MTVDVSKALPCPFCGSTDLVEGDWYINDEEVEAIECNSCYGGAPVKAWNNRSTEPLNFWRL